MASRHTLSETREGSCGISVWLLTSAYLKWAVSIYPQQRVRRRVRPLCTWR
jgi:hypothetical protein